MIEPFVPAAQHALAAGLDRHERADQVDVDDAADLVDVGLDDVPPRPLEVLQAGAGRAWRRRRGRPSGRPAWLMPAAVTSTSMPP